jgi:NADH-quinone oxidoreductase subunit G
MAVQSSQNQVLRYVGVDVDPVNWGWLCDRGRFGHEYVNSPERLRGPLVRRGDDGLVGATWSAAVRTAAAAIAGALERGGPASVAVIGGARLTNEDAYAWAKLAKGVIGTDNVDAQLGDGLPAELVLGLPPATIDEVCRPGGTVIVAAADLKEELPVLFLRLRHAVVNDGVTVIELSPQRTSVSELAAVTILHRPGEVAVAARALIGAGVEGDGQSLDQGLLAEARALLPPGDDPPVTVVVGRQSLAESDEFVADAAAALRAGLPAARFLPALRRANVRGALDMGLTPGFLPGRTTLDAGRSVYGRSWPALPAERGLDTAGILAAAAAGAIEVLVLLGADPLADFPDAELARRALAAVPTVVAVDLFPTGSVLQADVVLPAAGFAEQDGTTTNVEGRVSRLRQKVTPPGTARPDWMIAAELATTLGADLRLESAEQIWAELISLAPAHRGLSLVDLGDVISGDGVVVPRPSTDAPPAGLYEFEPGEPVGLAPNDAYGVRLVLTRKLYDLGTTVQQSPSLAGLAPGSVLRVNAYDFDKLGVAPGERVRVKSPRGAVTTEIVRDPGLPRGSAGYHANQPGVDLGGLLDAGQRVTHVRIDSEPAPAPAGAGPGAEG